MEYGNAFTSCAQQSTAIATLRDKLTIDSKQKNYIAHNKARIPATTSQQLDNKSTKFTTDLRSLFYRKSTTGSQQDDSYGNQFIQ